MIAEPCTTESCRKRHLSTDLAPDERRYPAPGRTGRTLCGYDARDEERARACQHRGSPVVIAELPECRSCAKAWRAAKPRSGAAS